MRVSGRTGGWLVGAVLGVLAIGAAAGAEEGLRAGMVELTFAGGLSVSHNLTLAEHLERVHGYHVLPHLGLVLTDEVGRGLWRGNLELLVEPTLFRIDASRPTIVYGADVLGRWIFAPSSRIRPYLELGGGVVRGPVRLHHTSCDVNFIIEGGPGVMLFVSHNAAITLGYRLQHISNGGLCTPNLGINSSLFTLGVTYFLP